MERVSVACSVEFAPMGLALGEQRAHSWGFHVTSPAASAQIGDRGVTMLLQRLAGSSVHTVANTKEVAALVVVQETCEDSEGRADQVVCDSVQDQLVPNDACYLKMVTCRCS
jgi:hypothetical protein